jgi:hypothetical protein
MMLVAEVGSSELGICGGMEEALTQVGLLPGASAMARAPVPLGRGTGKKPGHRAAGQGLHCRDIAPVLLTEVVPLEPVGQPLQARVSLVAVHRGEHTRLVQSVVGLSVVVRPGAMGCWPASHVEYREVHWVLPTLAVMVPAGHCAHTPVGIAA